MAKIAVDIVLLPSEEMTEMAISTNKELLKQNPAKIVLDKKNCIPHISLAMGCIDERKINEIDNILKTIAKEKAVRQLKALGIDIQDRGNGEKISGVILKGKYLDIGKWKTILNTEKELLKFLDMSLHIKEREKMMEKIKNHENDH